MRKRRHHYSKHATTNPANLTPTKEAFLMGFGLGAALVEFLAAGFGYF